MKSDNRHLLEALAEQLATFSIEAHLADDPKIIEGCSAFLRNVIHFWNKYKEEIPSVDALTIATYLLNLVLVYEKRSFSSTRVSILFGEPRRCHSG